LNKNQKIVFEAKSIAIIRTDKIGDMVLTLPLFQALKKRFPEKKIVMIASQYTKALLESTLNENEYYCIENQDDLKRYLFKNKIDVAFFPRPRFNEALSSLAARVKLRIGSAYRLYSFLFNYKIKDHRKIAKYHEAEYNVRMLSSLLEENITVELIKPKVTDQSLESLNKILSLYNFDYNMKFIILHPGSGGSARDWSIDNFQKLNSELLNLGYQTIITGVKSELEICSKVSSSSTAINLCGKLEFDELLALISKATMLIANSTGVIHLAASLNIATIGFYPNTSHLSSKRWGPYSNKSNIISPPNSSDDMNLIKISEVLEKVKNLSYK
jgi:heptosyltransferase-3